MHSASNLYALRQQLAIQEIIRQQQMQKQLRNSSYLPRQETSSQVINDILRRNRTLLELEKLKLMLDAAGAAKGFMGAFTNPLTNGTVVPNLKHRRNLQLDWSLVQTPDTSADFQASKQDSPRSDVSSGLGTLASPLSEWDVLSSLATPSPAFEYSDPILVTPERDSTRVEGKKTDDELTVNYQGRNLLDLNHNMRHQWAFQMAVLPARTVANEQHFRSVFHRLGPFGLIEYTSENCSDCGFCSVNIAPQVK